MLLLFVLGVAVPMMLFGHGREWGKYYVGFWGNISVFPTNHEKEKEC